MTVGKTSELSGLSKGMITWLRFDEKTMIGEGIGTMMELFSGDGVF